MDARKDDPVPGNDRVTWADSDATAADAPASSDAGELRLPAAVRNGDEPLATHLATQLCLGFRRHDERDREGAVAAFATVDRFQFQHVAASTARAASEAFVDALWAKDAIEDACRDDGALDRELLADMEWTAVESALAERAALVGLDPRYAELTTAGWRRHELGGDYWTPHLAAQRLELRAAVRDPGYPRKERGGRSGPGAEATRYLLGVELHDLRRWDEARDALVPYFERIAQAHGAAPSADD